MKLFTNPFTSDVLYITEDEIKRLLEKKELSCGPLNIILCENQEELEAKLGWKPI